MRSRLVSAGVAELLEEEAPTTLPPDVRDSREPSSALPLVMLSERLASTDDATAIVTSDEPSLRQAAIAHIQRLLRLRCSASSDAIGQVRVIRAQRLDLGEIVDALADALGVELETLRAETVSQRLAERLRHGRTSVVVAVDEPSAARSSWVPLVLREMVAALSHKRDAARLVFVGPPSCAALNTLAELRVPSIALTTELDPREVWSWIDAVARSAGRALTPATVSLRRLENVLASEELRRVLGEAPELAPLGDGLALPNAPSNDLRPQSPWAWFRRAVECIEADDHSGAETAIERAEKLADDLDARRDLGRRWTEVLERGLPGDVIAHARAATLRAISRSDADEAVRWGSFALRAAELAQIGDGETAVLLETQGRALIAKGDVVMARAVLSRAHQRAVAANLPPGALASIAAEVAEAAYIAGDFEACEREARRAMTCEDSSCELRLRASNVIGRLFLARREWAKADMHFAADAIEAARVGDRSAELRALSNRAIAFLWSERFDEAESVLETVVDGGRAQSAPRPLALALQGLAVVADRRREYGRALDYMEESIDILKAHGPVTMLADAMHTYGQICVRIGDLAQATDAVRVATTLFRRGLAAPVMARLGLLRARIAVQSGQPEEARRLAVQVREILTASVGGETLAECDRFEARLALEHGDLKGARAAIDRARAGHEDEKVGMRAEVALIEAEWLRASGATAAEILAAAGEGLALARTSADGDEELLIEAHMLVAEVSQANDDAELGLVHLALAESVRDSMMRSIPEAKRALFLARPEIARIAKLRKRAASEPPLHTVSSGTRPAQIESGGRRLVGDHSSIRALSAAIRRVAASDTTVLIHGESGTGKELVAEALHAASDRKDGPLVRVNCAALAESLLISELFGHEKGAFTNASTRRRGRFEVADGGTLFLDEIGDISPRTQVALLRVLQEKTFDRVGGVTPIRVDVRVVCATHRDLRAMVSRGEFREDLYYRLRCVQLDVPPLRARLTDLRPICAHVLRRVAAEHAHAARTLSRDALELLCAYAWPGNVRELENVLRAVALLADGAEITANDLREHVDTLRNVSLPTRAREDQPSPMHPLGEASVTAAAFGQIRGGAVSLVEMKRLIERDCVIRALSETNGNITRAAVLLGMKRPRLSQLVKHYGLQSVFMEGS